MGLGPQARFTRPGTPRARRSGEGLIEKPRERYNHTDVHRPIGTDSGYFWSRAGHSASFYGSDSPGLTAAVALHAVSALRNAGTALLVVTPAHRQAILASVSAKCDVKKALDVGALVVFDALETLDRVSFRGYPDPVRFQTVIARTVEDVTGTRSPVYAYGEMVGLLWKAAQYPAALRLEQLWNGLCRRFPLALHCGYPIDVLSEGFEASAVGAILHAHDRVLAGERAEQLATAVDRALGEILAIGGAVAAAVPRRMRSARSVGGAPAGGGDDSVAEERLAEASRRSAGARAAVLRIIGLIVFG